MTASLLVWITLAVNVVMLVINGRNLRRLRRTQRVVDAMLSRQGPAGGRPTYR